jgi:two-component system response regulator QseB
MQPSERRTALRYPVLLMVPLHHTTSRMLQALRTTGFETRILDTAPEALDTARAHSLAAVVLDVALVGPDPATFLDALHRADPELPVIALTSREQREHTVSLLRGTKDDYLTTPFPVEELVSRLRLRMHTRMPVDRTVLRTGTITIDTALGLVSIGGRLVTLSPTEYAVLVALATQRDGPVPQSRLATAVWGRNRSSNLVEVYIGYLRRKLGAERIRTVRGAGYVLEG